MPEQVKYCNGCVFFRPGFRDANSFWHPNVSEFGPKHVVTGLCCIRSSSESYFPERFPDDWCGEFKRREEIQGYRADGHLTTG